MMYAIDAYTVYSTTDSTGALYCEGPQSITEHPSLDGAIYGAIGQIVDGKRGVGCLSIIDLHGRRWNHNPTEGHHGAGLRAWCRLSIDGDILETYTVEEAR